MCKQIIAVILVLLVSTSANASFAPLSIENKYTALSLALYPVGGVSARLAGLFYSMLQGSSSKVSSNGVISRPSNAVWIDLTASPPGVQQKSLSAKMDDDTARKLSKKTNPDGSNKYPNVYNSYNGLAVSPIDHNINQGDVFSTNGSFSRATSCYHSNTSNDNSASGPYIKGDPAYEVGYYGSSDSFERGYKQFDYCAVTPTDKPPTTSYPVPKSNTNLTGSSDGGPVKTAIQDELDKMFQDPDYVPTFTDDTTGLPYAPPASDHVATPAQVDKYNANGQALDSSSGTADAYKKAADTAGDQYRASGGDPATGTGGDPSLYQKYLDALGKQKEAEAARDKLAAEQTGQEESGTDDSTYSGTFDGSTPYGDQSKDFNFGSRFQAFVNEMKNTAIFSLPNQFLANIPSSSTSTMSFSGGRFGQFTYDFAQFNSLFAVLKAIVLVLFGWVSIKIVLLKGGSQ